MEYSYEYRDDSCVLVCKLDKETISTYIYYMLAENNIENIIRPVYEQGEDGYERLVYNLENRCTLNDYMTYYGNDKRVCDGVKKAWSELDSYMIDDRFCMWDLNYVYVDCETGKPGIICLPVESYISDAIDRTWYIGYLTPQYYTETKAEYVGDVEAYEETDSCEYQDAEYETTVLCQEDVMITAFGSSSQNKPVWIVNEEIIDRDDGRIYKKSGKRHKKTVKSRITARETKKRQPKIVRLVKEKKKVPEYIIPGRIG